MSRKPAHLEMTGGKTPRQHIWEQIRKLRIFTLAQLRGELPGSTKRHTILTYLQCLTAAHYLEGIQIGNASGFELKKDAGLEAPRLRKDGSEVVQGLAQEQMWRTLRMMRTTEFSPEALADQASTPEVRIGIITARDYLRHLQQAGYLNRQANRYRLTRDTGPRPPMIQRVKAVYDPNLNEVVWTAKGEANG